MNDSPKPTTRAELVQQILRWILEGHSASEIRQEVEKEFPDQAAQPLILEALQLGRDQADRPHDDVHSWCLQAMMHLYQKQFEIGEYAGAMRSILQIHKLSAARSTQTPVPQLVEHHHFHELGPITQANLNEHRQRLIQRVIEVSGTSRDARGPAGG